MAATTFDRRPALRNGFGFNVTFWFGSARRRATNDAAARLSHLDRENSCLAL
jgi:hypothetical protein